MKIAFIGLGITGKPISKHLLKVGYSLTVFDRNAVVLDELTAAGEHRVGGQSTDSNGL
ncbi:NAD(P)-binding domain-containing protein [Yersinia aldovae]|uniref:NAD(P)-binding domain-containing protein n=1 Tax=Yersinia aldovae TaxID=29483 RepID=UPI0005AD2B14|nr:NAD(P)-binding domain-containing protein [Yersinia aldovae]AJJ63957.1 2-hydroxy-3-oxopropionate reductase [Yersinia aldovae 670-83]